MQHGIPLSEYIASNNPKGASEIMATYGPAPESEEELIEGINGIIAKGDEKDILTLMEAHPDKELIEASTSGSTDETGLWLGRTFNKFPTWAKVLVAAFAVKGALDLLRR